MLTPEVIEVSLSSFSSPGISLVSGFFFLSRNAKREDKAMGKERERLTRKLLNSSLSLLSFSGSLGMLCPVIQDARD